jgi:hypothetical protein
MQATLAAPLSGAFAYLCRGACVKRASCCRCRSCVSGGGPWARSRIWVWCARAPGLIWVRDRRAVGRGERPRREKDPVGVRQVVGEGQRALQVRLRGPDRPGARRDVRHAVVGRGGDARKQRERHERGAECRQRTRAGPAERPDTATHVRHGDLRAAGGRRRGERPPSCGAPTVPDGPVAAAPVAWSRGTAGLTTPSPPGSRCRPSCSRRSRRARGARARGRRTSRASGGSRP